MAFDAFALLAADTTVGYELAWQYMHDFLCERLDSANALVLCVLTGGA